MEILSQKEKRLIAVAASIASGCLPCTVHHIKSVREAGAAEAEVLGAIPPGWSGEEFGEVAGCFLHKRINWGTFWVSVWVSRVTPNDICFVV